MPGDEEIDHLEVFTAATPNLPAWVSVDGEPVRWPVYSITVEREPMELPEVTLVFRARRVTFHPPV